MNARLAWTIALLASVVIVAVESKTLNPYKVLGVEKNASQRQIQKAFHKLSLQYHPDKNKCANAQQRFAEINNAYEILSDEEKRKNYDLYGDEKGNPGFDAGADGRRGGYAHFTSGGQGDNSFSFRPDGWPNMDGNQQSGSFSFSFGSPSGQRSPGFSLNGIFSNIFGDGQNNDGGFGGFGGFGAPKKPQPGSRSSPKSIQAVNSQIFQKQIADQGITWLLLAYKVKSEGNQEYESIIEEVSRLLDGALKAGSIDCQQDQSFCKSLGINPRRSPKVFLYSYKGGESGLLLEYSGDLTVKSLKTFSHDHLPKFSKRVDLSLSDFSSSNVHGRPSVMLLSTKKDTPVIWRALSGLYRKHFVFYDSKIHDVSDPLVKTLGVNALPAILGWLPNGEKHILKTGISVKDLKSAIHDLSALLDSFERKGRMAASSQSKKPHVKSEHGQIPLLTGSNFDVLCGETTPVCIIGAFRSSKAKEKLESILLMVSQKSLLRQPNRASSSRDSVSYVLVDASKQTTFLNAFEKSGFKSLDKLLVAFKPRKQKFAAFTSEPTAEKVESFISSVLNGDIQFQKTRQKPMLK